jgi:hypothetical protein
MTTGFALKFVQGISNFTLPKYPENDRTETQNRSIAEKERKKQKRNLLG